MSEGPTEESNSATDSDFPPEEALSLVGNETRLSILRALAETPNEKVSFSELRERVGERDSGKFNYHLKRLSGHFARQTDDGYELTMAGRRLVGAVFAGTYTDSPSFDPIEMDAPCPDCGGTLVAEYEDEHVRVHCVDCEGWRNEFTFPPGSVEQFDREELPAAFDRWLRTVAERIVSGFCANCSGRIMASLLVDDEHPDGAYAGYACERCGDRAKLSLYAPLLFHPAGVAFLYDHGIDVTASPTWEISRRVVDTVEVISEDPSRAGVVLAVDDERFVAEFDEDATVVSAEREPVDESV